jgi:hypothetical protein
MTPASPSPLTTLLITGLLAILGTVAGGLIQGYWDTTLADKSFQTELVMKALEADEQEARINSLRFMIETNLIADPAIRSGLEQYLNRKPEAVPQIRATPLAYTPGVVVPSTTETVGFTDFSVFVCDEAWDSDAGKDAAAAVIEALRQAGSSGRIDLKQWRLYDEIQLARLRDKLTLVVDRDHGEAAEIPRLKRVLGKTGIADIQVVDNPGKASPWLISLITCPTR